MYKLNSLIVLFFLFMAIFLTMNNPISAQYVISPADKPPDTPSQWDDEFDSNSLDTKWSWLNQGSSTVEVAYDRLAICPQYNSTDYLRIIEQDAPDGDFTITAKLSILAPKLNFRQWGIGIRNSSTGKILSFGYSNANSGGNIDMHRWNSATSWNSAYGAFSLSSNYGVNIFKDIYFRLFADRTNGWLRMYVSYDGIDWYNTGNESISFFISSFNKICLVANYLSSSGGTNLDVAQWFRVNWTPDYSSNSSNNSSVNFSNTSSIADGNNSQALLFNAYKSSTQLEGDLSVFGNTKYSSDRGANFSGAGSIMFMDDGGNMNFFVSPEAPEINGKDQDINWGSPKMIIKRTGKIGIGTSTPDKLLTVNGSIHSKEVVVDVNVQPDFVFEKDYKLMPIKELESYVTKNKHLPEIPSASEVKQNGVSLGDTQSKLLQKIEELTLYVIEQNKRIEKLEKENKILKTK